MLRALNYKKLRAYLGNENHTRGVEQTHKWYSIIKQVGCVSKNNNNTSGVEKSYRWYSIIKKLHVCGKCHTSGVEKTHKRFSIIKKLCKSKN